LELLLKVFEVSSPFYPTIDMAHQDSKE